MAKYIKGQHLTNLQKSKLVFWTKGNAPTQEVNHLTYDIVLKNLKLLYLLSEKVIASASYFFESSITQQVTDSLNNFFEEGDILYFFDDDLESPTEHAKKKIAKSPRGLSVYRDKKKVLSDAKKLETFGDNLLRRPPLSISDKIVELWINDILSTENYSIGASITREVQSGIKQKEIKDKLISFARNRDKDFVWEYIKPILKSYGLNNSYFQKMIQKKLSHMYAIATANVLGVELDEKLNYNLIDKNSKYDTNLFSTCLNQLGILHLIFQLNNDELKQLKYSFEFVIFRDFYFKMIEDCEFQTEKIRGSIDVFNKIETAKPNSISKEEFLKRFLEYSKLCNYPPKKFRQRLDEIKTNLDNFNTSTAGIINNLISLIRGEQVASSPKGIIDEDIKLKLSGYKKSAFHTFFLYLLFFGIAIIAFKIKIPEEKLNDVLFLNITWENIKTLSALIVFLIPMIRSFIKHDNVIKSFLFIFSKKERIRIKKEFENEQ